jgi:ApbE superfamily uncharacterized protein (UPF0280 family)
MGPTRTPLPGGRWHFAHGPIELVIGADIASGAPEHTLPTAAALPMTRRVPAASETTVQVAHEQAWARFQNVLQELVAELPLLRQPVQHGPCPVQGPVARRMWQACAALPTDFITPMAAVAGAVAQEILTPYAQAGLQRAYVNNGGDIALHLAPGAQWRVGMVADIAKRRTALDGGFTLQACDPVRGVATSGWRGRSHSLGIADAVTVLAATAAQADAAATVIANAVNPTEPDARLGIERAPARSLKDDSDLGERLVTVAVPALAAGVVTAALRRGAGIAQQLQGAGLIHAAVLVCQGQTLTIEPALALKQAA